MLTYFLYEATDRRWHWYVTLDGGTRRIAASTTSYPTQDKCREDILLMQTLSATATVTAIDERTYRTAKSK